MCVREFRGGCATREGEIIGHIDGNQPLEENIPTLQMGFGEKRICLYIYVEVNESGIYGCSYDLACPVDLYIHVKIQFLTPQRTHQAGNGCYLDNHFHSHRYLKATINIAIYDTVTTCSHCSIL